MEYQLIDWYLQILKTEGRGRYFPTPALLYFCTFISIKPGIQTRKQSTFVSGFCIFKITFSMLGEPGLYFLYFLQNLGCVGRMKWGLRCYRSCSSSCTQQLVLHQKEHFVNYFLTCYVLPGNDLRPVG